VLNLPTPASALTVVTGSGVSTIAVHASIVDLGPGTTVTPGAFNTPITAAGTTVAVPAPGAGVDRNVKFLSINNESASSCVITVQITDGVNTVNVFGPIPLPPAWTIQYNSDGNGFVVYDDAGNIQVATRVAAIAAIAAGTQTGSTGTVIFSNSNGVSFGMSDSSVVTASFSTGQGSLNISAGTTSNLASAFTFANSNGISFGLDASILTASVATSLTNINISAGTTSQDISAFAFANANNVSFGLNGSVVTASASAVSSQGSINVSAGTTSNNLSAVTFANANGVSFGINGSTVTASMVAVGTVTAFSQDADFVTNFPVVAGVLSLQKLSLAMNLQATALAIIADFKGATNLSDAVTLSHAVYTLSGGTASLASSGSRLFSWSSGAETSASSVYGGASGTRYRTLAVSYAMTPGDYLFGWWISTGNGVIVNAFGRAAMNIVGTFDGIETSCFLPGVSASTLGAFPASIPATAVGYVRTGFSALRQPGVILVGTS
jgi:hypothetical protein